MERICDWVWDWDWSVRVELVMGCEDKGLTEVLRKRKTDFEGKRERVRGGCRELSIFEMKGFCCCRALSFSKTRVLKYTVDQWPTIG